MGPGRCGPCREESRQFRRARALAPFDSDVRRCLHALKYGGRRRLARVLGREASRRWLSSGDLSGSAAVVPVPLARRRRRQRGFNQAELIAKAVAREAGIELATRVLRKTKERPPQTGLTAEARRRNAARTYEAKLPASLRGQVLLLVDDVFTTGATADAAAQALLSAGAAAVDVLTIARVL
jgi:ComF family protein